jgi:hypothetical protein
VSREDADYIMSTFPIVKAKDESAFGTYITRNLILGYLEEISRGTLRHIDIKLP